MAISLNLPLGGHGLFAGRKSGMRLAALDGALRERAAAHGFNVGQFGGKLMHTMRNLGRGNSSVRRSIELLLEPQDEWDGRGAQKLCKNSAISNCLDFRVGELAAQRK